MADSSTRLVWREGVQANRLLRFARRHPYVVQQSPG